MPRTHTWLARALGALGLTLLAHTSPADDEVTRSVPESGAQLQLSYAPLVKQVAPSVVNIYARRLVRSRPFFDDPFFGASLARIPSLGRRASDLRTRSARASS